MRKRVRSQRAPWRSEPAFDGAIMAKIGNGVNAAKQGGIRVVLPASDCPKKRGNISPWERWRTGTSALPGAAFRCLFAGRACPFQLSQEEAQVYQSWSKSDVTV